MKKCKNCNAILLPGANFCHKCGASTKDDEPKEVIGDLQNTLFAEANNEPSEVEADVSAEVVSEIATNDFYVFDSANSIELDLNKGAQESNNQQNTNKNIENLFKTHFFEALRNRVVEEHNPLHYSDYVEAYYHTDFQRLITSHIELWTEERKRLTAKNVATEEIETIQQKSLEKLLNYFIIKECAALNEVHLNEKILRYDDLKLESIKIDQMIQDFLNLDEEKNIVIYKNFITMPSERLETAVKSFATAPRDERLYFIADASITGTCKEGFAMTDYALYWKAPLEKAHRVAYTDIKTVTRHKDWIEINGLFFNIHKTLNVRILRLLKTLKMLGSL